MDTVIPSAPSDEARLLTRVSALAHRAARRLVGRDAAKDLAQEVVLDCLVRLRTGRWCVATTLEALVASMTWRQHAYAMRRTAHRLAREAQHVAERVARTPAWMDPERVFEQWEEDTLRERALSELPAACRATFRLVREEGATYRIAARRLGISCGLVFSHVARAERHLASRLMGTRSWNDTPPSRRRRSRRRRRTSRVRLRATPEGTPHDDGATARGAAAIAKVVAPTSHRA